MASVSKAYRVYQEGDRIKGQIEEVPLDDLGAGEVLIRVEYSSVNYKDALAATGQGKILRKFPLVAGVDAAGVVAASSVSHFREGDTVLVTGYEFGVAHDGGYSEYARVPAEWVVPIRKGMSTFQAMALGTAGFTVALCIKRLEDNGQHPDLGPFIVTGATGGVGMLAIDILSGLGYKVTAVTGKQDTSELLQVLGADSIMDRHKIKTDGPPLERGQWGGAIDNVGGQMLAWLIRTVVPWGNIASVGLAGGAELRTTVMPFILRGVSILGITSSGCPAALRHSLWQRLDSDLAPRHLDKIVTRVATLEELPDIFASMLAGKTTGRTVIKIGEG